MGESEQTTSKPIRGPNGQTFESFDACVAAMSDEEGIDDPEAFCAWLEEEGKEALSDPNAQEVLAGLEVEFVSAVDDPAQDSEWVIAKNADDPEGDTHRWQTEVTLYVAKSKDDGGANREKQVAFAPVLIPKEADKQGDVIPAPAIENAAHKYLAEYRKVDSDHDLRDGKGVPVESWTLKQDTSFERPDGTESRNYPEGTWVMGIKFDDETWERVKAGELTGLSIYGGAKPVDVDELLGKDSARINDPNESVAMSKDTDESHESVSKQGAGELVEDKIQAAIGESDADREDVVGEIAQNAGVDQDVVEQFLAGNTECPDIDVLQAAGEVVGIDTEDLVAATPDSCEYENISMANDDDPGDSGNDEHEPAWKQDLSADQVSTMLSAFGTMVEDGTVSRDASVEDFVRAILTETGVNEQEVTGLSVFLGGGGAEPEADSSDEEMSGDDDEGIDLDVDDADKSDDVDDGGDAAKDTDADTDTDGDVDKSVDDGTDDRIDRLADTVESLQSTVKELQAEVEDQGPRGLRMGENGDGDRLEAVKSLFGLESDEEAEVARKAVVEQVEKSDEGPSEVDYSGITEDEDAGPEASDDSDSSLHSAAANKRMVGGDN